MKRPAVYILPKLFFYPRCGHTGTKGGGEFPALLLTLRPCRNEAGGIQTIQQFNNSTIATHLASRQGRGLEQAWPGNSLRVFICTL